MQGRLWMCHAEMSAKRTGGWTRHMGNRPVKGKQPLEIFYRAACLAANSRDSQSMKTRTRGESWRLRG